MSRNEDWEKFEDYIAEKLKEIDPYCMPTPGSGNGNCKGDIKFSEPIPLHFEAKQRDTLNVTIMMAVWDKMLGEVPFHVDKLPVLALENKDKRRFAVLDLTDFLEMYIEYHKLKNGE